MAEPKTRPTGASVEKFLDESTDGQRRADCQVVLEIMQRATRAKPKMWGPSIVGFGGYTYKYQSGNELDWPIVGFSPRKQDLTLYLGGLERHTALLARLGKHKRSKSCLYLKRLADVDVTVLRELIAAAVAYTRSKAE